MHWHFIELLGFGFGIEIIILLGAQAVIKKKN
jgi:hypothetical protein